MDHRRDDRHMELIVHLQRQVVEELLPPLVMGLARGVGVVLTSTLRRGILHLGSDVVVLSEGGSNHLGVHPHVLRQLLPGLVVLHQPPAHVVLAMPRDLLRGLAVQHQPERSLALPHAPGHVVTAPELIREPLPVLIQQNAADTSQGLSSQELDLRVRLLGMHQARRMHLHPLQIHRVAAHRHGHLDPIPRGMLSVRGREVRQVRPVLLEQGPLSEVSTESARGQDHRPVGLPLLAVRGLVLHSDHRPIPALDQAVHFRLVHDHRLVGFLLDILELLHQRIGDGHPRELLRPTMSSRSRMPPQPRQQRQIQAERVLQPFNAIAALMGQHAHQIRPGGATPHGIRLKQLR
mmetsp:Transcript_13979/g.35216  ORF Transcript_13979/g.35216 Transcript_13979/m.35216 type:complete len:349 (-) Transcript_13979:229-1275(-)